MLLLSHDSRLTDVELLLTVFINLMSVFGNENLICLIIFLSNSFTSYYTTEP